MRPTEYLFVLECASANAEGRDDSLLDEKQRRLYAGLEALKTGHGGDIRIAKLLGLDRGTVARGRQELLRQEIDTERVRRAGGGRQSVEKKRQK